MQIGERYDAIEFDRVTEGQASHKVYVDAPVRTRLTEYVKDATVIPVRPDSVVGTLVEADFENRTARLRSPTQQAVTVIFDEDLSDDIQSTLRQLANFEGAVAYDPKTNVAKQVRVQRLTRSEQLPLLDSEDFWRERSVEDLAHEQATERPVSLRELYDDEASEDDRNAFLAGLAELA